jgi:hypothetical protein
MDINDQIIEWLDGAQDYQEGLRFLQKVSKKRILIQKLMNWKAKDPLSRLYVRYHEKLVYELGRFVYPLQVPALNKKEPADDNNGSPEDLHSTKIITNKISRDGWNENNHQSFIKRQLTNY